MGETATTILFNVNFPYPILSSFTLYLLYAYITFLLPIALRSFTYIVVAIASNTFINLLFERENHKYIILPDWLRTAQFNILLP